jgi:NADPH:quinone reductase-like Zn-dependent oxidoreductase
LRARRAPKALGARVVGVASNERKADAARLAGADEVVITSIYRLEEGSEALRQLDTRKAIGKIVLTL